MSAQELEYPVDLQRAGIGIQVAGQKLPDGERGAGKPR